MYVTLAGHHYIYGGKRHDARALCWLMCGHLDRALGSLRKADRNYARAAELSGDWWA